MLVLPLVCYLITAITFVFPPLSPLFEVYKSTHCTFVKTIPPVPAWNPEVSLKICKSVEILADLFSKASPADVCYKVEEKGLSVVFPAAPPALKPVFMSGLFAPPVCPVSPSFFFSAPPPPPTPTSPLPPRSEKSFTGLFKEHMAALSEGLSLEVIIRTLMVIFALITMRKLLSRGFGFERRGTCPVPLVHNKN